MNKWKVEYLPAALQDRRRLDGSVRKTVDKAIDKVSTNPLPVDEGGYGKPLGNKSGNNLTGLLKREDETVYREASRRLKN